MIPLRILALLVTLALKAWAQTKTVSPGTTSKSSVENQLPNKPTIFLAEDGMPILKHTTGRLLGRDVKVDLSGLPVDLNNLPIKTEVNLEGEDIAIWALKSAHVDAVKPVLKDFLCGNPEYAPLFPILCRLQQSSETQSRSLTRSTPTAGSDEYKTSSPNSNAVPKPTKPKAGTLTVSPSRRLSTTLVAKGKGYITSTIELDDKGSPLIPARTRPGGKSQRKTAIRGGGFSRLTPSREPKSTRRHTTTKDSRSKFSTGKTHDGKSTSTKSGGFRLTRTLQSRSSSHTKNSTPSTKSSAPTSSNNSSGRITNSRFPSQPVHSTASSKSNQSATSKSQQDMTSIGKETTRPKVSSATNISGGTELLPSKSSPGHPTRSTLTRSKAGFRTRSIHRTLSVPANVTSATSILMTSGASSTKIPGTEISSARTERSSRPPKVTFNSSKSSTSHSTSIKDQRKTQTRILTTGSQSSSSSQVRTTTRSPSTPTISKTGAIKTSSESSRRS